MTAHENNGIQGAMSKKGRANLGSAFFVLDYAVLSLSRRSSPERPSSAVACYGGWKDGSSLLSPLTPILAEMPVRTYILVTI
jgi:hypothetical protein